ncbi:hypothetical protein CEXT_154701 [Caerostris extrusa]|uniref:Uncharacterized protein n=1 Tax=Caerostris extrusa TaxID=172846 RepID=A0AAV4VEC8_CAEEX|nr:hypothetical protein CEXT_154701 [Caerostris extrusa]
MIYELQRSKKLENHLHLGRKREEKVLYVCAADRLKFLKKNLLNKPLLSETRIWRGQIIKSHFGGKRKKDSKKWISVKSSDEWCITLSRFS